MDYSNIPTEMYPLAKLFFEGILPLMMLVTPIVIFVTIVYWKIYKKAGEPGWKVLIPIYNVIVLFKIAGLPIWYFILSFIPLVNIYVAFKLYIELAHKFGKSTVFGIVMLFFPIIGLPILAFSKNAVYNNENKETGIKDNNLSQPKETKIEQNQQQTKDKKIVEPAIILIIVICLLAIGTLTTYKILSKDHNLSNGENNQNLPSDSNNNTNTNDDDVNNNNNNNDQNNNSTNNTQYASWTEYVLGQNITSIKVSECVDGKEIAYEITKNELNNIFKEVKKGRVFKDYDGGLGGTCSSSMSVSYKSNNKTYELKLVGSSYIDLKNLQDSEVSKYLEKENYTILNDSNSTKAKGFMFIYNEEIIEDIIRSKKGTNSNDNGDNVNTLDNAIIKSKFQMTLELLSAHKSYPIAVLEKLGFNPIELGEANENIKVSGIPCNSTTIESSVYKKEMLKYMSEKMLTNFRYIVTTEKYVHVAPTGGTGYDVEVVEINKVKTGEYTAEVTTTYINGSKTTATYNFTTVELNGTHVIDTIESQ